MHVKIFWTSEKVLGTSYPNFLNFAISNISLIESILSEYYFLYSYKYVDGISLDALPKHARCALR